MGKHPLLTFKVVLIITGMNVTVIYVTVIQKKKLKSKYRAGKANLDMTSIRFAFPRNGRSLLSFTGSASLSCQNTKQ